MELNKYQELAARTLPLSGENHVFHAGPDPRKFKHFEQCIDLLHGFMGLTTELGEAVDPFKRHVFYGMVLEDKHWLNMKEEAGDALWYIACLCRGLNCTLEELAQMNIAKLAKRYPGRFSNEAALNRDTNAETVVMQHAICSAPKNENYLDRLRRQIAHAEANVEFWRAECETYGDNLSQHLYNLADNTLANLNIEKHKLENA